MEGLFRFLPSGDPREFSFDTIITTIQSLTTLALTLFGVVAFAMILWGGFQYISAFGDESKAAAAKKTLTWAIVGIIVIIMSGVIINFILSIFT